MNVTVRRASLVILLGFAVTGAYALGRAAADQPPQPPHLPAIVQGAGGGGAPAPASFPDFRNVAKEVIPSVVTVRSERTVQVQQQGMPFLGGPFDGDLFGRFFGQPQGPDQQPPEYHQSGLGSGVIVSSDGYILTNNHVVEHSDSVEVVDSAGETLKAKVLGTDPQTDIAVLKVDATGLTPIHMGNSDALEVGEWVLAVGNPFSEALGHTVTAGIVSATGRANLQLADYEDFIQTDAAINPGNSGGALVNEDGQLVGINTAILSRSGGNQGIGFAIPINMARNVMEQLIKTGKVTRGWLGVGIQNLTPDIAEGLGIKDQKGAIVSEVQPGTPAADAGLKQGDVIVGLNGKPVESSLDLRNSIAETKPDTKVDLDIIRGEQHESINVTLGERENGQENGGSASGSEPGSVEKDLGLSVRPLTRDLAARLGYDGDQGVIVTRVEPGSSADEAGLQRGDLIKQINHHTITGMEDYNGAFGAVKQGQVAVLLVRRGDSTVFVPVRR
ncbi:MAG TPA: DegQ family serine endoprotease [Candidatus Saccharimonadales bacterium]|nr:DegQ family serine endoprotease [Candidatus Saccharimonadales bacterium]